MRIQRAPEKSGETYALELGVESRFEDLRILKRIQHICRELFSARQINRLYRLVVKCVGEQENLKIRAVRVAVHAAFRKRGRAVGFDIDAQDRHVLTSNHLGCPFRDSPFVDAHSVNRPINRENPRRPRWRRRASPRRCGRSAVRRPTRTARRSGNRPRPCLH